MNVKEFIDEFNKSQNKDACVKKHITTSYIPYTTKVSICNKIATTTTHKTVQGKEVFSIDSSMRYMLFVCSVIDKYTDLDLGKGAERMNGFDLLEQYNVMYFISSCLGDEYKRLETVLKMKVEDIYSNERDFASFLETKLDALSIVLDQMGKIYEQKNQQYVGTENKTD
ncbi:hypothetical protein [Butyrivibrio sp. INlla21]|uniref:hypothetical protein n=1 Tax=Butyrivibrio sp. INlla21 TaxID=1520811 RepID=UPI0008EF7B80|nr:hypothetical protein [Butyrivibrio sp. INlla21]SFU36171.1 hypothetical protein SAMN02910342_00242 [Butyrivibrio sp. INlla21]